MLSQVSRSVLRQARPQFRAQSLSQLQRLLSTLAVLEQNNGVLNMGSLSAVTAAKKLGGPITAFVAGGNIKSVAEAAAKVEGVEKVISIDNSAYDRVSTFLLFGDGRMENHSKRATKWTLDFMLCVKQVLTHMSLGPPRKLRTTPRRKHQVRRLHPHPLRPHCFWQEFDATRRRYP